MIRKRVIIRGSWNLCSAALTLALVLTLAGLALPAGLGAPSVAHAQQSGWGIYVNPGGDYTVDVGEKSPYGDDLDFGCFGNYANQWPEGSTSDSPRWAAIDAAGNITGGCHVLEGNSQDGRLIQGTLSGTFNPASNSISDFHLQTSETITNNIDGKISWGTSILTVDNGSGGLNPETGSYITHLVTGRFKVAYVDAGGSHAGIEGTIALRLTIRASGPWFTLDRSKAARFSALLVSATGLRPNTNVDIMWQGKKLFGVQRTTKVEQSPTIPGSGCRMTPPSASTRSGRSRAIPRPTRLKWKSIRFPTRS